MDTRSGFDFMPEIMRQNFADCKRKIFPGLVGQNPAMPTDYRQTFQDNLRSLVDASGKSRNSISRAAVYSAGPKKGKRISVRTIGNLITGAEGTSGLSIDGIAALALALAVEPYHLLVPGLDPFTQPVGKAESWIESEVERRLAARLRRAGPLVRALEAKDDEKDAAGRRKGNAKHPWPDIAAPTGDGRRQAGKAAKGRSTKVRAK